MFYRAKQLYKNAALRLLLFVAISDFVHASSSLPYTIYLTAFTFITPINLDPHYIMFASIPLPFQLKLKLTLTAAIALQRMLALFLPVVYRKLSSSYYASMSLLLGILFGCVDLFVEFALSPIKESPNCATMGCFVSDRFLYYWGTSNLVIGIFIIVFTIMILFKLRSMYHRSKVLHTRAEKEANRFNQCYCSYIERLSVNLAYIYINSFILLLQFTGITCNWIIIYMFYRAKQLYKNAALRLLLFVAISDFVHASSTLPYTIYLTAFTITPPINLDPYYIMFSSTPLPFQLKLKLTLTIAIALQRTLALFLPVLYRKLSSSSYTTMSLLLGILLGFVDLFLEFALTYRRKSKLRYYRMFRQ
ncbi:hypothetical protein Y032_0042g599 [Ancylostoma ceylanicum]|nr:hypothetical protein Y032_0042g599 [Ancylostoma ceylanicum]